MVHSLVTGVVDVPVSALTPHPENPRRGAVELIKASLAANGQYKPLVVQTSTGYVLAGNHTLKAARELKWETVSVVYVDVDDDRAMKILLADNRTSDNSTYDDAALLDLLQSLNGDFVGTGYDDDDLAQLAELTGQTIELPPTPALNEPDDVPAAPRTAFSKPGDVWVLGPHRLLCGDSTDVEAVVAMLGGDVADCMWTDPPYGVEYVGGNHSKTQAERRAAGGMEIRNDGAADLPDLLAGAFGTATVVLRPGAPVYVAHPQGPLSMQFADAFLAAGWAYRQTLIWVKDSMVLSRSDYHYRHEPILYGFTAHPGGEGRLGRGGDFWHGDNSQTSVFEVARPKRSDLHPTMKPVELVTAMLRNSCPPGGLVFEPFGGSGTTLMAANVLGMRAALVELDPVYTDVICRRFQEHTGLQPILQSTGEPHDFTLEG